MNNNTASGPSELGVSPLAVNAGEVLHKGYYLTILLGSVYYISNSTHYDYRVVRPRHHLKLEKLPFMHATILHRVVVRAASI